MKAQRLDQRLDITKELTRMKQRMDYLAATVNKKKSLARVYYVKDGKKIRIVRLENFKSMKQISEKWGAALADDYMSAFPFMSLEGENLVLLYVGENGGKHQITIKMTGDTGTTLIKEYFTIFVTLARQCGKRLSDLIKKHKTRAQRIVNVKMLEI